MRNFNPETAIRLLDDAGFLQPDTLLDYYVMTGARTGNFSGLEGFLDRHPGILSQAKTIIETREAMEKICPFAPFPDRDEFPEENDIPLDIINPKGERLYLSETDLTQHGLVMGRSGSGKTNFVKGLVTSVLDNSDSVVWAIDPQKQYRSFAKLDKDFIVLTSGNFRQNFFEPPTDRMNPIEWAQVICEIIQLESGFMTHSKNVLLDILLKLYRKRGVIEGSKNYPTPLDVLNYLKYWKEDASRKRDYRVSDGFNVLINRFLDFVNMETIFNVKHSIPIEALMNTNLVLDLPELKSETYNTIISVLAAKAFHWRMHHKFDHLILMIIEEARKSFSAKHDRSANANDPFLVDFLTKSRAYKIGFLLVTQEPSSISQIAKSNVGLQVLLSLFEGNEVAAAARSMNLTKAQHDFFYTLQQGQAIIKYARYPRPFLLAIDHHQMPEPPSDEEVEAQAKEWFKSINYPPKKPEQKTENLLDDKGKEKSQEKSKSEQEEIPPKGIVILDYLADHPFTPYTKLRKQLEMHSEESRRCITWLEKNKYIIVHKNIKTSLRQSSWFFELTEKTSKKVKVKKLKGKGSYKHKAYCHQIAASLESKGEQPEIEAYLNGKHIDVLSDNIAYEVTISMTNITDNVQKDLEAGVDKVVIATENGDDRKKAKRIVKEHPDLMKKTEFQLIGKLIEQKKKKED